MIIIQSFYHFIVISKKKQKKKKIGCSFSKAYRERDTHRSDLTNLVSRVAPLSLSPPLVVIIIAFFALAQRSVLSLIGRNARSSGSLLMIQNVVSALEHLVDFLFGLVDLPHRIGRITAIAVSVARHRPTISEVSPVPEIAEALLTVEKSTTTVATASAPTAAIVESTTAPVAETIVVLIIVESISILEVIPTTAMIGIVEALKAGLVIGPAIIVQTKLSLPVITSVARPTAAATPGVGSRSRS